MELTNLSIKQIREAPWNPNYLDEATLRRLRRSIERFDLVTPLVVRRIEPGLYETIGGAQRLAVLREMDVTVVPAVVVDADDVEARLLSQALNRIAGEDDLGLRAQLMREVLETRSQEEVISLLPETAESLIALASLGQEEMASHLLAWQEAQNARLKHLQFQLTPVQLEVVEEVLARLIPEAKVARGDSPNTRGTALYLLCKKLLDMEEALP